MMSGWLMYIGFYEYVWVIVARLKRMIVSESFFDPNRRGENKMKVVP